MGEDRATSTLHAAETTEAAPQPLIGGCVDYYGYSPNAAGWFIGGWVGLGWAHSEGRPSVAVRFQQETATGLGRLCCFPRSDVHGIGTGFVLFLASAKPDLTELAELQMELGETRCRLLPSAGTEHTPGSDTLARARQSLPLATDSADRTRLLHLVDRPPAPEGDTLDTLPWPCMLELDATYFCPPAGLALTGWFADPFSQVLALRLRSGNETHDISWNDTVPVARPDALDTLEAQDGAIPLRCGFVIYAASVFAPGRPVHIEVETHDGQVATRRVAPPQTTGMAAMKTLLARFDLGFGELTHAFDTVAGPAVRAMNRFRLSHPPTQTIVRFGTPHPAPRVSLIIRLGRVLDDMEAQLASFARTLGDDVELIYVLDDPAALRAAQTLAASSFARFGLAFTLVGLGHATGPAAARNIGLGHARGQFVGFLDTCIFPATPDWLDTLLRTLCTTPDAGAVGAMLLFDDGTVNHAGAALAARPEEGGWGFPAYPGRGRLPPEATQPMAVEALSAACLLLPRDLAQKLGGFDEDFVLDGFEAIDFCRRIADAGLVCVMDPKARLFHLNHPAEAGLHESWGPNLRRFDAWQYAAKWGPSGQASA